MYCSMSACRDNIITEATSGLSLPHGPREVTPRPVSIKCQGVSGLLKTRGTLMSEPPNTVTLCYGRQDALACVSASS
jgi:hypothetical protein